MTRAIFAHISLAQVHQMHQNANAATVLTDWTTKALKGEPSPWPLGDTPSDIQAVRAFLEAEVTGPLCHHSLQTASAQELVPESIWELLCRQRRLHTALELSREYHDTLVLQHLDDIGLNPLVLKGAAYAHTLYPEPHLRPRCDTDLLFAHRAAAEKAWTCLSQEGYELLPKVVTGRYVSRQRTCVKPVAGGHTLDLHWSISNTQTFAQALPYDELDCNAVPLPSVQLRARTLNTTDSLLFACVHLFGHGQSEPKPRLLWLYDIFLLSRHMSRSDWESFICKAIDKRIAGVCRYSLDRVTERFPIPPVKAHRPNLVAAEAHESLRPERLTNPFLYHFYDLQALDGLGAKLQWIRETLFPSPDYMRRKYGKKNAAWLPLLYIHRGVSGVRKRLSG